MRIIELFLDPESIEGGVDSIALVDKPAHESNFLTFSSEDPELPLTEMTFVGEMFEAEEQVGIAKAINTLGTPTGLLEAMGWTMESIEPVVSMVEEMKIFKGAIVAEPNQPSKMDRPDQRVRYKYIKNPSFEGSAIIPTSRDFCKEMIRYDRVFKFEDIARMTEEGANSEFGVYDIFTWRGSYNCRHLWVKVVYRPSGPITARQRPVSEGAPDWRQPSTRVGMNKEILVEEEFGILAMIDGQPLFSSKEDALKLAEILGCEGYHEHEVGDYTGYMACEKHEFESYDDYPQAASDAACKVLRWIDEHGRDEVEGMGSVGLARANQLCSREPISRDTIARMASFARHKKNSEINPEFKGTPWKDKGYVAWLGWGSDEGINWAQKKLDEIDTEMDNENFCWEGYKQQGTKLKDGKQVPNCVKMTDEEIEMQFAEGMPHYTKDGVLYEGPTHRHNDRLMTGAEHTEDSEYLYHKDELATIGPRGGINKSPKAPASDTPNKTPKGEGTAKGDASNTRTAKVPKDVEETLQNKADDFNEKHKEKLGYGATIGQLRAVYNRGLGAYNTSHSPVIKSAKAWAMARVNAYLYLLKTGRPENKKYTTDYDLLPSKHPKKQEMEIDTSSLSPYTDQIGRSGVTIENVFKHEFSYNDEKKELTGAAVIPNRMIVRRNPITEDLYYVFFSRETTKLLSERFMETKKTDQTNINHTEIAAPGTYVVESWLVDDPKLDKSYALGLEYPEGTWVITMKVKDDDFWKEIKQGKYRGYSIEGYFNERVVFS